MVSASASSSERSQLGSSNAALAATAGEECARQRRSSSTTSHFKSSVISPGVSGDGMIDDGPALKRATGSASDTIGRAEAGAILPTAPEQDAAQHHKIDLASSASSSPAAATASQEPSTPEPSKAAQTGLAILRSPAEQLQISLDAARTTIFEGGSLQKIPFNKPGYIHARQFQVVIDQHYRAVAAKREQDRLVAMRAHGWSSQQEVEAALGPARRRRVAPRKRDRAMVRADTAMTAGIQRGEGGWETLSLTWREPPKEGASLLPFSSSGTRSVCLLQAREVVLGHKTPAFRSQKARGNDRVPPPEQCLSLMCGDRTVDLAVSMRRGQ